MSAVTWGVAIIGCAFKLKGTTCYDGINLLLIGGAGAHLLFVWIPWPINSAGTPKLEVNRRPETVLRLEAEKLNDSENAK